MADKAPSPIPPGVNTITPYLTYTGNCKEAIELYKEVFRSKLVGDVAFAPDGKVMHAMLRIGDSNIMLSDTWGENPSYENPAITLWMYSENCDEVFNRAVNAGFKVTMPLEDAFWGDRLGQVQDPFGHRWSIATWKKSPSQDEMIKGIEDWAKKAGL